MNVRSSLPHGSNIRQWSKTQTTHALSSAEAELHEINSGITQGLECTATQLPPSAFVAAEA